MSNDKNLMFEAAVLYYEKKHTQQEIANALNLSRQTVSKLLNDAIKENIVEIKINNPKSTCREIEKEICEKFGIRECSVCSVSNSNNSLRYLETVKLAVQHITPILQKGDMKIALSWGRTVQEFIKSLPDIKTSGNIVFPLFGATEDQNSYFSSNELSRRMADKIGADFKCALFPYLLENNQDYDAIINMSFYKKMKELWENADIAIVGIGNTDIYNVFGKTFGYNQNHQNIVGDIATHFFYENGKVKKLYENTLCASADDIKKAKTTVAIASGDDKAVAISGALKTNLIDHLITDEYTARQVLSV